jgi:hypothetical protein
MMNVSREQVLAHSDTEDQNDSPGTT